MSVDKRTWAYKNGEGRIFASPEDVPSGWTDTPAKTDPDPAPDAASDLRAEAEGLGIKVDGRWSEARLKSEIEKAQNGDGS